MFITVTQEDLDKAIDETSRDNDQGHSSCHCVVAQALIRATNHPFWACASVVAEKGTFLHQYGNDIHELIGADSIIDKFDNYTPRNIEDLDHKDFVGKTFELVEK